MCSKISGYSSSGGDSDALDAALCWRLLECLSQIDKDLHRTFPGHPAMDAAGRAALRRLLGAYARRNPAVGYCQGLNFIAATFALLMGEEDAFWCLAAVVENLQGGEYFDERMVAPQVGMRAGGREDASSTQRTDGLPSPSNVRRSQ